MQSDRFKKTVVRAVDLKYCFLFDSLSSFSLFTTPGEPSQRLDERGTQMTPAQQGKQFVVEIVGPPGTRDYIRSALKFTESQVVESSVRGFVEGVGGCSSVRLLQV